MHHRNVLLTILTSAVLAALLAWVLWVEAAGAQAPSPWIFSGYSTERRHTWWTRPGSVDGELPVVVTGGGTGRALCISGLCVLTVFGPWTRIDAGGETIKPVEVVYLAVVQVP